MCLQHECFFDRSNVMQGRCESGRYVTIIRRYFESDVMLWVHRTVEQRLNAITMLQHLQVSALAQFRNDTKSRFSGFLEESSSTHRSFELCVYNTSAFLTVRV